MMVECQVHQPRMKVFTVGLDDKEKAKQADKAIDGNDKDMTKIPIDSTSSSPALTPRPSSSSVSHRKTYMRSCGVLSWLIAAFFVVLLCITISEIAYNRQRDQAFLRLKWAELRQRMLGYELLSQAQQQQQQMDERLAFSHLNTPAEVLPLRETPTVANQEDNHEFKKLDTPTSVGDARLDFLRSFLNKIREKAADMGLNGDMQVHVIEVKPMEQQQMSRQAWEDGFGEVAAPKQHFGPWQKEEDYADYDSMRPPASLFLPPVHPFQFDRWSRFNQPQWNQNDFDYPSQQDFRQPQQPFMYDNRQPFQMQWPSRQPEWSNFAVPQETRMYQPPTVGQQNQFPFPVQNQVPIIGTPEEKARPWYMNSGDDERWAQTWNNDWNNNNNQVNNNNNQMFQPNPIASSPQWALNDNTNEGIDNFQQQEAFNVPIDVTHDNEPKTVSKGEFRVNAWQHTQPDEAQNSEPISVPIVSDSADMGPSEDKDFLPIRSDDDVMMSPDERQNDAGFDKKFDTPFFQIDDPSSFKKA